MSLNSKFKLHFCNTRCNAIKNNMDLQRSQGQVLKKEGVVQPNYDVRSVVQSNMRNGFI